MSESASSMVPPWEQFPTYERYTIGWRMGDGELYMHRWRDHVYDLPPDRASRLEYLRRYRPAPLNWWDEVLYVLDPHGTVDLEDDGAGQTRMLLELGLVEHDAAYTTWRGQRIGICWPWHLSSTPVGAARHSTREFWFFSRQMVTVRRSDTVHLESIPAKWSEVGPQLLTGLLGEVDPTRGLLTLARMLCAGDVRPPWALGLDVDEFEDSFDADMGYCDAFRLWLMCAFDDDEYLRGMFDPRDIPGSWSDWLEEHASFR